MLSHLITFHHIFFIHSAIDRYLGSFQVLPVVDNAARSVECRRFLETLFLFPLGTFPGVGLLAHMPVLFFKFSRDLHPVLWIGKERSGLFGSVSHGGGSRAPTPSLPPQKEISS